MANTSTNKKKTNVIIIVLCILFFIVIVAHKNCQDDKKPRVSYNYLLYLPDNYRADLNSDFPLIIYLHGASLRGSDLNLVKKYGLPELIEKGEKFEFIIVSPQCPSGKYWDTENWFDNLYNELITKYRIDTSRVYLTGMSMGGFGTWNTAIEYPDRFAAIVPLCGGGKVSKVCKIKHVPVWVFHGTEDSVVPISRSEELVNKLKQCGGNVEFTRLKDKGHSIQRVYEDRRIYSWMLENHK